MISRSTVVKVVVVFLVVQVLLYETGAFSALFKKPRSTNQDIESEKSNWYDDTEDTAGTENTIASKANNIGLSKPQSTNQDYDSKKSNLHETKNTGVSKVKTKKAVSSREYDDKFLHPKKQTELWIRISGAFIVRRVGYLDLRDKESVKIYLIGMKDRATADPHIYMRLYYKDTSKKGPSNCLKTELENYSQSGMDDFVLYLIKSLTLNPGLFEQVSNVTISTDEQCKNESDVIYIQSVEAKEYQYNFGMCLHKSIEGKFKPKLLLDWVKLNIALGAEFMQLYLQGEAEGVYDILLPYINRGIVEVLDWKLEPGITNRPSYHFGQTGVIVECLWRNIYRTRYLGLNDVDEFLVPQKHKTLPELILHVETLHKSKKPVASFVFTNTLMKDNGSLLPVVEKALQSGSCSEIDRDTLSVYFKRTKSCLCFSAKTKKMILKPDAVYIPWVHFLYTYRSKHYKKEFSVPDDVGLSYHYRPNWKGYSGCNTPVIENRSIEKYFKNITNCS